MQFDAKVHSQDKGILSIRINAAGLEKARLQAGSQGFRVVSIRKARTFGALQLPLKLKFSVQLFSRELLSLTEAGLNLSESCDVLSRKTEFTAAVDVLPSLIRELKEGKSFSAALASLSEVFPPLYVATIRTSEQTGDLAAALNSYLAYEQQMNQVRQKVVSASVYPALLVGVGALVIMFLLGYVVPRFSHIYEDLGGNLPWMSRMMMRWGQLVSQHATGMLLSFAAILGAFVAAFSRHSTRAHIERLAWRLPVLGEKIRLYELGRFTRTLAMLVNGGIPFVTALDMVGGLLRQPALKAGLAGASKSVREGRMVSDAFASNGLATEVGVRLIAVGEKSGDLGTSMVRVASLYEDEVSRWVDWFTRLFEPILMLVIGIVIGLIVVLMYLPIFELADSLQ